MPGLKKTKLDSLARTMHFLKAEARKQGYRSFEEYLAHQAIAENDRNLLYKIVDKWLPDLKSVQNTHAVDPESIAKIEKLMGVMVRLTQETPQLRPVAAEYQEVEDACESEGAAKPG